MCMFIYAANWVAKWIFPIDVVDCRSSPISLMATLQRPQFPNISVDLFTLLTLLLANFSVRFVISCSLSGGRSVPIATLFVRARADLQAPSRGRCTWASRCCCRHCRCCGCIGKPDQAPCTYRGNGPGCWLLFCHKLQTSFATRLFW